MASWMITLYLASIIEGVTNKLKEAQRGAPVSARVTAGTINATGAINARATAGDINAIEPQQGLLMLEPQQGLLMLEPQQGY